MNKLADSSKQQDFTEYGSIEEIKAYRGHKKHVRDG